MEEKGVFDLFSLQVNYFSLKNLLTRALTLMLMMI